MKSRPAASILAQQGGSLLKFDFENRSPVFLTLLPQARAETETALGCASRELHPSEDLSELPPLHVAVAGQEYQRWCCHRKTGRPRSAFWTNGPANHLPCRIDADSSAQMGHRAFLQCRLPFAGHTSGCFSASGYVLDKVHERFPVSSEKCPSLLIRFQRLSDSQISKNFTERS